MRLRCDPLTANPGIGPLIFEWDEAAGTVSGPGAAEVARYVDAGEVPLHPLPGAYPLGRDALKHREALAAIVGYLHRLPDDLADAYPRIADDDIPERSYTDADGAIVIGRDALLF